MDLPSIRACIFDMDGLLLNTEDLITTCINIILQKYGKSTLPWSLKARIQGRTAKESNAILLEWAQLPITTDDFLAQVNKLHEEIFPTAESLPGVNALLYTLQTRYAGTAELALATSSSQSKFSLKTVRWKRLFECFPTECRVLGDDERVKKHKPAPDIYLCALQCINDRLASRREGGGETETTPLIDAKECLVFEDSLQGVEAGRRAGMQVVWCPHPMLLREILEGGDEAEEVRSTFDRVFGFSENDSVRGVEVSALAGKIQEATKGWITLLPSLEHFPYARYGMRRVGETGHSVK